MSKPMSYNDALADCLEVMRSGGDIQEAVARYPQHDAALRDDVRIAYALRRASFRIVPPEGADMRAAMRLTNALREARAEMQPKQRKSLLPFGWITGALGPVAIAAAAVVAM